ncbi:MAG: hypothetical protein K1X74_14795 [Pirellulales bacterium]|nr:hypothetical protein [Pirellulales bacterium]
MTDLRTITPAEIETRQDELLAQLDELNRRIERALADAAAPLVAPAASEILPEQRAA